MSISRYFSAMMSWLQDWVKWKAEFSYETSFWSRAQSQPQASLIMRGDLFFPKILF